MTGQVMLGSFSSIDISSSGLSAERYRMEIIANNIANAYSTSTPEGGPYRRQEVVFASALDNAGVRGLSSGSNYRMQTPGVKVAGIVSDPTEFPLVYNPGHPEANDDGMVAMPNVRMPNEMVDLITASRAYEANLRSIRTFREMTQQTLAILRGIG